MVGGVCTSPAFHISLTNTSKTGAMEVFSIGVLHSPFSPDNMPPDQGISTEEISKIEIFPEYRKGLCGLEKCDKIVVVYWIGDGSSRNALLNTRKNRGCFATRTPNRPNPIAVSIAKVVSFSKSEIVVKYLEGFNGSRILDLKPHSRKLDGGYKEAVPPSDET